jgi:hypothetical protein
MTVRKETQRGQFRRNVMLICPILGGGQFARNGGQFVSEYTFELYNSGIRLADSIIYQSLLIVMDSVQYLKDIVLYKSNIDEVNVLSISHLDNLSNSKVFNSEKIEINKLNAFSSVYLLLAYQYKDNLTAETKKSFSIFRASSLEKGQRQFGINVKDFEKEAIKIHLLKFNKKLYDNFYN